MTKSSTKAESHNALIYVVLILIVVLVMGAFIIGIKKFSEKKTPTMICKSSVYMHALARIGGINYLSEIDCPTQYIEVEQRDKEKVMKEMADKLVECWDMFGEGEFKLFDDEILAASNKCVVCHHMTFSQKHQIPMSEFVEYLKTHQFKNPDSGKFEYYAEYLYPHEGKYGWQTEWRNIELPPQTSGAVIDTSVPYATVLSYTKVGSFNSIFGALTTAGGIATVSAWSIVSGPPGWIGGAILFGAGATAGGAAATQVGGVSQTWDAGVVLYPYTTEAMKNLNCTELPAGQRALE